MTLRGSLQVARIPVLLGLLLPATPVGSRFTRAARSSAWEAAWWPWLVLLAVAIAFVAVAVTSRGRRHPTWLLAVESVIAGFIGLVMPLWSLWVPSGPFGWPPRVLRPLAERLISPTALEPGMVPGGQAMHWFVLVLALAWLVIVAHTAIRQRRATPSGLHAAYTAPASAEDGAEQRPAHAPREVPSPERGRRSLQLARLLGLLALLVLAHPVLARWNEAVRVLQVETLRWTWAALAVVAIAFVAAALTGRARRHPAWLLAVESIIAVLVALVVFLPGALGGFIYAFTGFEEMIGPLLERAIMLNPPWRWFGQVLTVAWLVIVAEAAIRQTRGAPRQALSRSTS